MFGGFADVRRFCKMFGGEQDKCNGVMEAHHGVMEAYYGAMEAHHEPWRLTLEP
jgi:hypothetical protein